ncbi:hypothetical protein ACS5NO_05450 [Larkinella sp. GY13]|uniref:hypothetical protein n=1 Tax=Larkinella sp. GY13 TaxID=3453720 RepID=UPI003EECEC28
MKTSSRNVIYALIATVLFSACSRPYATYQKMPVEHYGSRKTQTPVAVPTEVVSAEKALATTQPDAAIIPSSSLPAVVGTPSTPSADVAKAKAAVDQVVASSANKVTSNKLQKSMARIQKMLGAENTQTAMDARKAGVAKKTNLAERLMLKNVDKKIKRALAPNHPNAPKAVNVIVTVGAIVALVGLILYLATTSNAIGITLLIVGLVLLLVGLIV